MRRTLTAICLTLAVAAGSAQARLEERAQYVGAAPALNVYCSTCAGTEANIGGVRMPATLVVPREVSFRDVSGGPVRYAIGQDIVGNNRLGDLYEPFVTGCGTVADLSASAERFEADDDLIVQILQPTPLEPCGAPAVLPIAGTIVVSYA